MGGCCSPVVRPVSRFTVARAVLTSCSAVSLFLCAVLMSAWFGESDRGLLATALSPSRLSNYYSCTSDPIRFGSKARRHTTPCHIHRFSPIVEGRLSAAERSATESTPARARPKKTSSRAPVPNEALASREAERKHEEEERREAQADNGTRRRVTSTGELTALAHEVNQPIVRRRNQRQYSCLRWLTARSPDLDRVMSFKNLRMSFLKVTNESRDARIAPQASTYIARCQTCGRASSMLRSACSQ